MICWPLSLLSPVTEMTVVTISIAVTAVKNTYIGKHYDVTCFMTVEQNQDFHALYVV